MSRQERTGSRDMTYSTWHRNWAELHIGSEASDRLAVIDRDWTEFCDRCWWPLAFMELVVDMGQSKKVAIITERSALRARMPSAVVFYRKAGPPGQIAAFRVRVMTPTPRAETVMSPKDYAEWLWAFHRKHLDICQGPSTTTDHLPREFPAFRTRSQEAA